MNSVHKQSIDYAIRLLNEIFGQRSQVQFELVQHTKLIIFERYLPEFKVLYLYAYDPNSLMIIWQQHFDVDILASDLKPYEKEIIIFLQGFLTLNKQVIIHFINFAEFPITNQNLKIELALKIIDHVVSPNKILIQMDGSCLKNIGPFENYLKVQLSLNQFVLLQLEKDIFPILSDYEKFTIKYIQQVQEINLQFIKQLEVNEEYARLYNLHALITNITKQQDLPNSTFYLATILNNLSKILHQDPIITISTLKQFNQNMNQNQGLQEYRKKRIQEIIAILPEQVAIFKDEKNRHFPMRQSNSQKCKVCQKKNLKVHKSNFKCESCFKQYKINITLCTLKCFKLFHLNPATYMSRKSRRNIVKAEE